MIDETHPAYRRVWCTLVEARAPLTAAQLMERAGASRVHVRANLRRWRAAGLVEQVRPRGPWRVLVPGEVLPPRLHSGPISLQDAVWTALRIGRAVTVEELQAILTQAGRLQGGAKLSSVRSYIERLSWFGYVRRQVGAGGVTVWSLVRDTGPLPPVIRRVAILRDPNTGQELHQTQATGALSEAEGADAD